MVFLLVGQAGLELPTSDDPPALASQNAGITGVSHRAWPSIHALLSTHSFIRHSSFKENLLPYNMIPTNIEKN